MEHDLQHTIALLRRTPASLDALLRDLPEGWTSRDEGEGSWSAKEIVAHLAYGEITDWVPRAKMILEHGEASEFVPFDRIGQRRDPQWNMTGKPLPQLLDEFAALRAESLETLAGFNLQPADLERRGRHPVFGSVTLSQLLAAWAGHDLTHLHQIARVMAHQYREAVGPWTKFLGVMQCNGHSS